ncbi:hypothetical protein GTZ85_21405 [Streptomyces sp. SID5474]|nr:hypothetical protein [Streptomyces sp. SID5474]
MGENLPWLDAVTYLGWDGEALTPTTMRPEPSAELWRAAIGPDDLVVLLPERILTAPMPVGPADRERLAALATPPTPVVSKVLVASPPPPAWEARTATPGDDA